MRDDIKNRKPVQVWSYFDKIRQIPHGSGDEKALGDFIIGVAQRNKMEWQRDEAGNIIVRKKGVSGKEKIGSVVLQSHLDMVCEKDSSVEHDFTKDPLRLKISGDYLMAQGTTLGADNGIGVAVALALIEEKKISHGPLEFLFTVDEESGLSGANNLKKGFLKSKRLINLDSEEDDSICIGCAGGADTTLRIRLRYETVPKDFLFCKISVSDLRGGHSGVDIHEERANAIKLLARCLSKIMDRCKFFLADIHGGNKRNAIPREAQAIIAIQKNERDLVKRIINEVEEAIKIEYAKKDKEAKLSVEFISKTEMKVISASLSKRIMHLLYSLPHGVLGMSAELKGLVETSTNLAIVSIHAGVLTIGINSRSSVATALRATLDRIKAIALLANTKVEFGGSYPGWQPNSDSQLLKAAKMMYEEFYGAVPVVKAIHAGLECGIIGEKFDKMDMISIGPKIENPHSPGERVKISTVAKFWEYLIKLLERLS